jgi:hypothetical protein
MPDDKGCSSVLQEVVNAEGDVNAAREEDIKGTGVIDIRLTWNC